MPVNVLLLNASLASPNQGINALTLGTLTALVHRFRQDLSVTILGERNCQHTVQVGNGGTIVAQEIPLRGRQFSLLIPAAFSSRIITHNEVGVITKNSKILEHLIRADHVIDLGAGDSFTDMYGLDRFVHQSLPRLATVASGKHLVFFPQTYGPFNTALGKWLATWLFAHSRLIFTRESYSTAVVQSYASKDKIFECSDMAFLMEPQPWENLPAAASGSDGFVGVNVSGLLFHADDNPRYRWSSYRYQAFTQAAITNFVRVFGRKVLLIPHVQAPNDRTDDVAASEIVYASLAPEIRESVELVREPLWAPQAKYLISKADFFLGARMHSCIAAVSTGVPVVPLSYSHKFQGVFGQLGLEDLVCSPEQMENDEMLAKVVNLYSNRIDIRARLISAMAGAKTRGLAVTHYL